MDRWGGESRRFPNQELPNPWPHSPQLSFGPLHARLGCSVTTRKEKNEISSCPTLFPSILLRIKICGFCGAKMAILRGDAHVFGALRPIPGIGFKRFESDVVKIGRRWKKKKKECKLLQIGGFCGFLFFSGSAHFSVDNVYLRPHVGFVGEVSNYFSPMRGGFKLFWSFLRTLPRAFGNFWHVPR